MDPLDGPAVDSFARQGLLLEVRVVDYYLDGGGRPFAGVHRLVAPEGELPVLNLEATELKTSREETYQITTAQMAPPADRSGKEDLLERMAPSDPKR